MNKRNFRISLMRQKTARENMLSAPNLSKHGIYTKWLGNGKNDTVALKRYLDVSKGTDGIACSTLLGINNRYKKNLKTNVLVFRFL